MEIFYVCKLCKAEFSSQLDYVDHYVKEHVLKDSLVQKMIRESVKKEERALEVPLEFREYIWGIVSLGKRGAIEWATENSKIYLLEIEKTISKMKEKGIKDIKEEDFIYLKSLFGYLHLISIILSKILE